MKKQLKISFFFNLFATLALGFIYPAIVVIVGFFIPSLSQSFQLTQTHLKKTQFYGRPSMSGGPYSGASNLSLTSAELHKQFEERLKQIRQYPLREGTVPYDLLFASASGYDPHISPQAAFYQILRIAQNQNIDVKMVKQLVDQHIQQKLWGFIGTDQVDVAKLNEDLEKLGVKFKSFSAPGIFRIER